VGETFPLSDRAGWTLTVLERESRYWVTALAGRKDDDFWQGRAATGWETQEAFSSRWLKAG